MCNDRHKRNFPIQERNEFSKDRLTEKSHHLSIHQNKVKCPLHPLPPRCRDDQLELRSRSTAVLPATF